MKQNNFTICEHKSIYYKNSSNIYGLDSDNNLCVPKKIFEDLKTFVLKNAEQSLFLKPSYKKTLGEILQVQNYVGTIQTKDGTVIEILPKIAKVNDEKQSREILVKMLKTLKKSPFKNFNTAHLKSHKMPLFEIFITMFLEELSKLIQKDLKSEYLQKQENLHFLKGKLIINEQIKRNFVQKQRFYTQFEEFTSNRVENKLIKTTLEFLYKKSKLNKNQQRIREFLFVFDEIDVSHNIKTDFSKVAINRQMKEYEQTLLWCKTFLLGNSFSPYRGNDIAFALLFDMNLLFESYVGNYLQKQGLNVSLQHRGKYLVQEPKKFALKPDIVITKEEEGKGIIIADAKWKTVCEEKDISQADMYQLYAYGTKYDNCKQLYLIYPLNENSKELEFVYNHNQELKLNIVFFDLQDTQNEFTLQ